MSELKENVPDDDFWRKAFEGADEAPPPRVWDAIERQLDESRGPRILPLWGTGLASSRPFVWGLGVAAAIAVLLVGWWTITSQTPEQQSVAQKQSVKPVYPTETVAKAPVTNASKSLNKTEQPTADVLASATKSSKEQAIQPTERTGQSSPTLVDQPHLRPSGETLARNSAPRSNRIQTVGSGNAQAPQALRPSSFTRQPDESAPNRPAQVRTLAARAANPSTDQVTMTLLTANRPAEPGQSQVTAPTEQSMLAVELLNGKPLRFRDLGPIHRIVWFRPTELPAEAEATQSKREPRELWASVSMMPGSFNPSVSVRQPTQATMANSFVPNTANVNQSSVNSRANFSVAYQAGAGIQLSEHWSIESGVGYLSGRSVVESPGQVAVASIQATNRNSPTSNLFVDALRNSSQNNLSANAPKSSSFDYLAANSGYVASNIYDNRSQQVVTNNYQFVQVPVQIGYQFLPKSRLGLSLVGGLLTNIFVRNTVADEVVVTAKDGVYRPLSLAATMGARLRYRPSRRWSASLSGVYQPSLSSTTQSNAQIDSRPTSTGMSFGLDYHF